MTDYHPKGANIVERRRALELFTDRLQERRHFAEYVNGTPTPEHVLYFHGDGGNGKSLLLDLLRLRYCFQLTPDQWTDICQLDGEAFVEAFEGINKYRIVPCAHLDFGVEPRGNDNPLEDVSALTMLRRQLARGGFRFPLFDYALVLQLQRTGRLSSGKLDEFFGSAGTDLAVEALNAIETLKGAQLIVKSLRLLGTHVDEDVTLYLKRRKLSGDIVQELEELDPLRELPLRLPGLLAADLADSLRSTRVQHERVVLMFDTHERFWGSLGRREGPTQFHHRDVWLRRLLLALDHSAGIIAVVVGRDPPRWADAAECPIDPKRVDLQLVGHFAEADARHYLHLGGIEDTVLQGALLRLAEVSPGEYHPLYTGLCGDVVLAARGRGVELTPDHLAEDTGTQINEVKARGRELLDRLLKWCDGEIVDAVEVLSACRSFDEKLFVELGRALNFACTHAAFKQITAFSFVWQQDGPRPTFRIHDLMRRIMRESKSERVLEAHCKLDAIYMQHAEAGDLSACVEALYHRFQSDAAKARIEWIRLFKLVSDRADYSIAEALAILLTQVKFGDGAATCWAFVGDMYRQVARFDAAHDALEHAAQLAEAAVRMQPDDAGVLDDKGNVLVFQAKLQSDLSNTKGARQQYKLAGEAFDNALKLNPHVVYSWNNKGNALLGLAELEVISDHEGALKAYIHAIDAYNRALQLAPEDAGCWINISYALQGLAQTEIALRDRFAAREFCSHAISASKKAISLGPENVEALNQLGNALSEFAHLQTAHSEVSTVSGLYRDAIRAYGLALTRAPEHVNVLNNKGNTLLRYAKLGIERSGNAAPRQSRRSVRLIRLAIKEYDRALEIAPRLIVAWSNKGGALQALAEQQVALADVKKACESYGLAIEAYDRALGGASGNVTASYSKGSALLGLATLQVASSDHIAAIKSCRLAIEANDQALLGAPKYANAWYNKGVALTMIADIQAALPDETAALHSYRMAVKAYSHVIKLSPKSWHAWTNRGNALQCYAKLLFSSSETVRLRIDNSRQLAIKFYCLAIKSYDQVLHHFPTDVDVLNAKALALLQLANSSDYVLSREAQQLAIKVCERGLSINPDLVSLRRLMSLACLGMGDITRADGGTRAERLRWWDSAKLHCARAIELAPDVHELKFISREICRRLESLD